MAELPIEPPDIAKALLESQRFGISCPSCVSVVAICLDSGVLQPSQADEAAAETPRLLFVEGLDCMNVHVGALLEPRRGRPTS